jgi:hypothetical protein
LELGLPVSIVSLQPVYFFLKRLTANQSFKYSFVQFCGAKTICFRSGSDFQKVLALALAPAPAPEIALELPVITDFIIKSTFFIVFYERISTKFTC